MVEEKRLRASEALVVVDQKSLAWNVAMGDGFELLLLENACLGNVDEAGIVRAALVQHRLVHVVVGRLLPVQIRCVRVNVGEYAVLAGPREAKRRAVLLAPDPVRTLASLLALLVQFPPEVLAWLLL